MTDLPDILARATPKVKPLVWHNFDAWTWWAEAECGTYHVEERNGGWRTDLRFRDASHIIYEIDDFETSQAAAQADYERRILSALEPPDTQLAAALIEAHKAMTELQRDMLERSRSGIDAIHGEEYRIVNAGRTAWHDFCATLARIDAIMNPGGGALKGD